MTKKEKYSTQAFEMQKFDIWCLMVRIEQNNRGNFEINYNFAIEQACQIIDTLKGNLIRAALAQESLIDICKDLFEFINENYEYFDKENKKTINSKCIKFLEFASQFNTFER